MKTVLITTMLLLSGLAMAEEKPRLGQFDPQQCGCETCFTKYGVCTSVNQNADRGEVQRKRDPARRSRGQRTSVQKL